MAERKRNGRCRKGRLRHDLERDGESQAWFFRQRGRGKRITWKGRTILLADGVKPKFEKEKKKGERGSRRKIFFLEEGLKVNAMFEHTT